MSGKVSGKGLGRVWEGSVVPWFGLYCLLVLFVLWFGLYCLLVCAVVLVYTVFWFVLWFWFILSFGLYCDFGLYGLLV